MFQPGNLTGLAGRGRGSSLFISSYLGQVATRTQVPNAFTSSQKQIMTRRWHYARDDITSLQLVFTNWWVNTVSGAEVAMGGTSTITAAVEYPAGVFTQVLFSGSASGSAASGATLVSDACAIAIPRGAAFYTRNFQTSSTGVIYCSFPSGTISDPTRGDACNFAASGLSDQTMSGTITNVENKTIAPMAAIIAQTRRPSVFLLGDSITMGFGDTFDTSGDIGQMARSIGPSFAYINGGENGDQAQFVAANNAKRAALIPYCSHAICGLGVNDFFTGLRTAAQVEGNLATVWALFAGKPIWQTTILPSTTGAWTQVNGSDQSLKTGNTPRVTFNNWLRAGGQAGLTGYFEVANAVESSQDSGKWKAPGYTADGGHPTQTGYLAIQSSGAINPALIRPY